MKSLIFLTTFLFGNMTFSQTPYQTKMTEALEQMAQVKSINDFQVAAGTFDRIAQVATNEWLPVYYQAQCYILMSFNDREADEAQKDTYLEAASPLIDRLVAMAPEESEVYALQALYYTAKLVVNPMSRAQKYGPLSTASLKKALALSPKNPRALQLDLSNRVGKARFFGKDISSYCGEAHQLLAEWDNYPRKGEFYPIWGKGQLLGIVNECPENSTETVAQAETPITYTLTVNINKLKSDNGRIMLELLNEKEEPVEQQIGLVKNKQATLQLEGLEPGTYAIRFFHDTNNNQTMDADKYGRPTESYGFSNNAKGFMGPPKYKKMLFDLNASTILNLKAR